MDFNKILEKEEKGIPKLPASNYELIKRQAIANTERAAMHFLTDGANFDQAISWNYKTLLEQINQVANLFRAFCFLFAKSND